MIGTVLALEESVEWPQFSSVRFGVRRHHVFSGHASKSNLMIFGSRDLLLLVRLKASPSDPNPGAKVGSLCNDSF